MRRALDAEWHQVVIDEEGMVRPVVERQRTTRGAEFASASQPLFALEADLQDLLALRRAEEVAMKLRMETCT